MTPVVNRIVISFLLILFALPAFSAEKSIRNFDIRLAGFKIGELTATQILINDSVTHYKLHSKVSFWFFYRVEVSYINTSSFMFGQLIDSEVNTITNRDQYHSASKWNKDHYQVTIDTYDYKKDTTFTKPIYFNIAKLFFEEPEDNMNIYADNYGIFAQSEYVTGKYYLVEVLGNRNKYYFKNGLLEKALMDSPIKNYEVKLID